MINLRRNRALSSTITTITSWLVSHQLLLPIIAINRISNKIWGYLEVSRRTFLIYESITEWQILSMLQTEKQQASRNPFLFDYTSWNVFPSVQVATRPSSFKIVQDHKHGFPTNPGIGSPFANKPVVLNSIATIMKHFETVGMIPVSK